MEQAEYIFESYKAQPQERDQMYVLIAWAEILLRHGDARCEQAQTDVRFFSTEPGENMNEAEQYLFPDGLPQPPTQEERE